MHENKQPNHKHNDKSQSTHQSVSGSMAGMNSQHIDDSDVEFPSDDSAISGFDDEDEDDFEFHDAVGEPGMHS
jgi:hypothetical protein